MIARRSASGCGAVPTGRGAAITVAAVVLVVAAWVLVTAWYLVWGIWLIPYRLLRRGARKRKVEAMRHRELMGTIHRSGPTARQEAAPDRRPSRAMAVSARGPSGSRGRPSPPRRGPRAQALGRSLG